MVEAGLWARAHGAQSTESDDKKAWLKVRRESFKRACRWHFQERERFQEREQSGVFGI